MTGIVTAYVCRSIFIISCFTTTTISNQLASSYHLSHVYPISALIKPSRKVQYLKSKERKKEKKDVQKTFFLHSYAFIVQREKCISCIVCFANVKMRSLLFAGMSHSHPPFFSLHAFIASSSILSRFDT